MTFSHSRKSRHWLAAARSRGLRLQAFVLDPNWKDMPDDLGLGGWG
jgi:hypothetical protein